MPVSAKALADRFSNRATLEKALAKQSVFEGQQAVIKEVARHSKILPYEQGELLVRQGEVDSDIMFLLCGTVIVSPNGRDDSERHAGNHIGEMTTIDPSVRRSADVRAKDEVVAACLPEAKFAAIANRYPFVWRNLACELAQRLRDRVRRVPARNVNARIFVGSSSEGLKLAKSLGRMLKKKYPDVNVWTEGIFTPGGTNIEALETEAVRSDFAVLILSPDDKVFSRGKASLAPRDNLIFELGLFMGAIRRNRALVVAPKGKRLKLPSDLDGMTTIRYEEAKLKAAVTQIESVVDALGPK